LFNRIKRDVNKFGGQPFIDNTNITVNQIVSASLRGTALADILKQHPDLESDDIHQALAFSIQDIFNGVSYWRHDGMTPLTQIKGYSEILVGKTDFDDLDTIPDEQKNQWMSTIHTSCQRGIARWQQMRQWMNTQYLQSDENDTEVYQIEHFVQEIIDVAKDYEPTIRFNVVDNEIHQDIESHPDTTTMIGSVLAFAKNTFQPEVQLSLSHANQHIGLSIERELIYIDDDLNKTLSAPYNPFSTAFMFFNAQDTPFLIKRQDHNVIMTIQLSILTASDKSQ